MATNKASSNFPKSRGMSRPASDSLEDIVIGTKVEFFFTTESGTARSAVGRVCDIKASGLCCVLFADFGCQKVPKRKLVRTTNAAPNCTAACANC
jgi:hypothetical protein